MNVKFVVVVAAHEDYVLEVLHVSELDAEQGLAGKAAAAELALEVAELGLGNAAAVVVEGFVDIVDSEVAAVVVDTVAEELPVLFFAKK